MVIERRQTVRLIGLPISFIQSTTVPRTSMKSTMVFIDEQNLTNGAETYYGKPKQLDYIELLDVLAEDYDLIRPYIFTSYTEKKPYNFYHFLRMEGGYRVISTPRRERGEDYIEKGVDIALATELIAQGLNGSFDVGILVSGDDDFNRAVRYVQDQGKVIIGAMFDNNASGNLKGTVDCFIDLDDHSERLRQ